MSQWRHFGWSVFVLMAAALQPIIGESEPIAKWSDHLSNGLLEISLRIPNQVTGENGAASTEKEPWRGLVMVTLKNISKQPVHYVDTFWGRDYVIDVIDADGNPAAKTHAGESIPQTDAERATYPLTRVLGVNLAPGEAATSTLYLSMLFELKPGTTYTIRIRRTLGLPAMDAYGNRLPETELRASVSARSGS